MPSPETSLFVSNHKAFDAAQLVTREAEVVRNPNWRQPYLRRHVLTAHVDMGTFTTVVAGEEHLVWSFNLYARHDGSGYLV
jgi:hypothetical protein